MVKARPQSMSLAKPVAFLPNLCQASAVFLLMLTGELLSLALTLANHGLVAFDWALFGQVSMFLQWIMLSSVALLCPLRGLLQRLSPIQAGSLCYGLVLSVTAIISLLVIGLLPDFREVGRFDFYWLLNNLLLAAVFAGIVLRYLYVHQQLINQQQAELQSRIQALQSRIRPHFLFNSMNALASLIAVDPERAEDLVVDLSMLFRATLAEPTMVTLAKELELCRHYIDIEQIRVGERLQVAWTLDGPLDQVQIPSLTLQPLLENAIVHGIQPLPEGGTVYVDVRAVSGEVIIEVRNPVPRSTRTELPGGNRMALDNIRKRLLVHFGDGSRLTAEPQDGVYVTRLSYPFTL